MSDTDSFIEEVSEELRRDQFFKTWKKYGWIVGGVIVAIVGGAAANEYLKAQAQAEAEARGGALFDAAYTENPSARADAFAKAAGETGVLARFGEANAYLEAGEIAKAETVLNAVASDAAVDALYRDAATLKLASLPVDGELDEAALNARLLGLGGVINRAGALSLTAREVRAGLLLGADRLDEAIADLQAIYSAAAAAETSRERAGQLLMVLGAELPEAVLLTQ